MSTRAPLNSHVLALSAELDALGGGDARVGEADVCCRVRPADQRETSIVTSGEGGGLAIVRDPRCPAELPAQQAFRRYRLSPEGLLGADSAAAGVSQPELWESFGRRAFDWWVAGWNATVVAHGETGSGKTLSLLGAGRAHEAEHGRDGLLMQMLERVFERVPSAQLRLGISCWEVRHTGAVDLLAGSTATTGRAGGVAPAPAASEFTAVHADSLDDARRILHLAQSRSLNWGPTLCSAEQCAALPNRASFFVRLLLHHGSQERVSALHLVDLVGAAPVPAGSSCGGGGNSRDYERRCLSQQLLCFNRVVSELAQMEAGEGAAARRSLLSARDSKLTQALPSTLPCSYGLGVLPQHLSSLAGARAAARGRVAPLPALVRARGARALP